GVFCAAGHGNTGNGHKVRRRLLAPKAESREALEFTEQAFIVQEKCFRRQDWPFTIAFQKLPAAVCILAEVANDGRGVSQRDSDGVARKIVKQGRCLLEEQRQVVLHPGKSDAVAYVLVW